MGPSPTPDLMDSLALFTHGEFLCFDNDNPELLLYTHGEFPRPGSGVTSVALAEPAVGVGRRRSRRPERPRDLDDETAISIALLAAEEDDEWW